MQEREPTNENIDFVRGSKLKYSPNKLKVRSNSEKQIRIKKNADVTQFKLQPPEGLNIYFYYFQFKIYYFPN